MIGFPTGCCFVEKSAFSEENMCGNSPCSSQHGELPLGVREIPPAMPVVPMKGGGFAQNWTWQQGEKRHEPCKDG